MQYVSWDEGFASSDLLITYILISAEGQWFSEEIFVAQTLAYYLLDQSLTKALKYVLICYFDTFEDTSHVQHTPE